MTLTDPKQGSARPLVVQKFGGTSVGTIERIRNVARRCIATQREGNDVVVIVSAMSGETNRLLGLAHEVSKVPDAREMDAIAATGEQVAAALTAIAIQAEGGQARSLLGHQVKILTDGAFTKARIKTIEGSKIFETTGDWEDFSTPSRDLRLLIAIDVALAVPARVARRPERYAMPADKTPEQVRADLGARLVRELHDRKFKYVRSDGSNFELALQDVVDREASLEMAYNPNDCVEARWGAPAGSDEGSTCKGHAPSTQVTKMTAYRSWFHERRRPPR